MEYKNLKISVIVPVYNVELYIKQCISSLLNQTYRNIEVILVNDGSTDDSGKICDEFATSDNRVVVVHQENKGVSCARNIGISIATGSYICFVDSDDWIDIDYFREAINVLNKEKPDILLHNYILNYENGRAEKNYEKHNDCNLEVDEALCVTIENKFVKWNAVAAFYSKEVFENIKFDENICYGEDLLYKFEVVRSATGKIIYQQLTKYHYRVRNYSACSSYPLVKKIDDLKVLEYIMKKSEGYISDLTFRKQYIPKLINYMYESTLSEDSTDNDLFAYFVDKVKQNYKRALNDKQLSVSKKLKVLTSFLPVNLLRRIVKVYAQLRSRRLARKTNKM